MNHGYEPTMSQTVVVVNGSPDVLGMIESVLDAGHYDMVFVDADNHAYSQIKSVKPQLVILCTRIEAIDGFQLLTMLKLDPETRDIPVVTYTTEYEGQDTGADFTPDDGEDRMYMPAPPTQMN